MFALHQPSFGYYNPYEEIAMQQELQRRRHLEAYLRRQREAEEMERRRQEYQAAVRAEYEQRREAELERRRQAELQRRRQAQQARQRHSMYDGGLESLFDALYGGQTPRQRQLWENSQEETQPSVPTRASPAQTPDPIPTSTPATSPASSPSATPAAVEPEHEPEEPQIDTAPSFAAVQSVLTSFATLQSDFTFPSQLDFLPGSSKLAYTPNNAPLHGYEHALTGLLTQLDAVESYGDDGVRKARKEAVKAIEKELQRLDRMKAEAWNRVNEPQPKASAEEAAEVEVDPISIPLPEATDEKDEDMKDNEVASELVVPQSSTTDGSVSIRLLAPIESTSTNHIESNAPGVEQPGLLAQPTDTDSALVSESPIPELALPNDADLDTPSLHSNPEPLACSLTSPSPSEASESDSDLDLDLGEYVDVGTMSTSEDEESEVEVERDGDLELIRDWDLDF